MKLVHFTFNNFFDYQIVLDNLNDLGYTILPLSTNFDKFQITYKWTHPELLAVEQITDVCKPLNIQFTTTLEVTEETIK